MEQTLHDDYKKARDEGKKSCRAKQLVEELYPDESFKASGQWFLRFTIHFEISLRRKMHCAQKDPQSLSYSIREVPFKGIAYPKTLNIPDERHRKHGSDIIALCDGRWKTYLEKGNP